MHPGSAVEAARPESRATEGAEATLSIEVEVTKPKRPKTRKHAARVVVDAKSKAFWGEIAETGTNEVVDHDRLWVPESASIAAACGDHADGNQVASKGRAARTVRGWRAPAVQVLLFGL
jgi:hypothetical protein